ncbi:hypothetical protein [Deinococcus sp.]|uniref:hypothetical protein n=1 Tax=Deinococcus sp. TaxID=47478 RepID=UPI003C7BC1EE
MRIRVSQWSVSRKKIRPSFNLGALGMLFSVSDRVSGPKLSQQDRIDTAYPYRLEVVVAGMARGTYRLNPAESSAPAWAEALAGRVWRAEHARGATRLVTDLTEYERLTWEELAAVGTPTLNFEPLG